MDERYVFKSFRKCISALNYGLVYFKPPKWTIRKNFKDRICALYSAINILIPLKRNERNPFAFYQFRGRKFPTLIWFKRLGFGQIGKVIFFNCSFKSRSKKLCFTIKLFQIVPKCAQNSNAWYVRTQKTLICFENGFLAFEIFLAKLF